MRKMIPVSIIYLGSLLLCTSVAHAVSLNEAIKATQQQSYSEALEQWKELANKGNAVAQYNLATFYRDGLGVQKNAQLADFWYNRAAKQGLAQAYQQLNNRIITPGQGIRVATSLTPGEWILAQNRNYYTLQLASSRNPKLIAKYYDENQIQGYGGYYSYKRDDQTWYALVYGAFPSVQDANTAIADLPQNLRKWSPWVRNLREVQKNVIEN